MVSGVLGSAEEGQPYSIKAKHSCEGNGWTRTITKRRCDLKELREPAKRKRTNVASGSTSCLAIVLGALARCGLGLGRTVLDCLFDNRFNLVPFFGFEFFLGAVCFAVLSLRPR